MTFTIFDEIQRCPSIILVYINSIFFFFISCTKNPKPFTIQVIAISFFAIHCPCLRRSFLCFKTFLLCLLYLNRPNNVKNMAFLAYFRQNRPKLNFLTIFNYAFWPSKKTLKTIKDCRRPWRIWFQLLKS